MLFVLLPETTHFQKEDQMKTKLAIAAGLLFSTSAMAHNSHDSCDIDLEHSVKVTPDYVQIMDGDKALYRITDDNRLLISGSEVSLSAEQQSALEDYNEQLQHVVPEVVELIKRAFIFARAALNTVFTELFGESSDLQPKVESIMANMEERFGPYLNNSDGEYLISKDGIELAGEQFGQEFEQEIEQLVEQSTGQLLMLVGQMMMNGEGGLEEFKQRMEAFGEQMETEGKALEQQGDAICIKMKRLESTESEMQQKIPQLAAYDLLKA